MRFVTSIDCLHDWLHSNVAVSGCARQSLMYCSAGADFHQSSKLPAHHAY